jgi:hypothetical protein
VRACLAVFDIFAVAGKDLRYLPYEDRRHRLTKRLRRVDEPLALMPPPTAPAHAAVWLRSTRPPALRVWSPKPLAHAYLPAAVRSRFAPRHRRSRHRRCDRPAGCPNRAHRRGDCPFVPNDLP